jgi:hypothetical protein
MAACTVTISGEITGLGEKDDILETFETSAPTKKVHIYGVQATADTAEALTVDGISTIELVVFKCVTNDAALDTSYVSAFSEEITVDEGEMAVFKPKGALWLKNNDSAEVVTYEMWIIGS